MNVEEQAGRSFQVAAQSAPPQATATAGGNEESSRGGTDPILIRHGQWTRAWATWQPASSRRARVTDVVVNLGPHAAFVWTLSLFPPGDILYYIFRHLSNLGFYRASRMSIVRVQLRDLYLTSPAVIVVCWNT